ncbi:type ISP restriction/modification enzyme [Nesterenkonia cremea]|uniref:Type ISP restriction-modification enzyme LLaBIII C-terminal specificity domain-containing protein n=1 Tax=Nesterenkonia cremea TaxID=1882340 RepID=A0A917ALL0_9MICC|nr:type ISP restriction/modification enzyme [Nesterenkonia cremea]GGE60757.1 hypothetical protein GCM10011401_04560 [Nesterenkonia cremea]
MAIVVGVKDPNHFGDCELHYRDIGDFLSTEEKLGLIRESTIDSTAWETITPNAKGEWINQSSDIFDTLLPLGDKKGDTGMTPVFKTYSPGLQTNRDAWVYNFSRDAVLRNVVTMTQTYDEVRYAYHTEPRAKRNEKDVAAWLSEHLSFSDPTQISWARSLRNFVARDRELKMAPDSHRVGLYRPFTKQHVFFGAGYNHERSQLPSMFPTPEHSNYGFYLHGINPGQPFALLATDQIPCLDLFGKAGQFFPRYTWKPIEDAETDLLSGLSDSDSGEVIDGYKRVDNISDETLSRYQNAFGQDVTGDAIFAHVYALLHSEQYRTTFSAELTRQLPRLPMPTSTADFWAFAETGQKLLNLHINYETVDPYPLVEESAFEGDDDASFYRVEKLKWGGKARAADKTRLVYNYNITLSGIPDEAHEYMLGSRSALEWLIDRYQGKRDKASGIVNDPNAWADEHEEPRYILDLIKRVTTVSVETVRLTKSLPDLRI